MALFQSGTAQAQLSGLPGAFSRLGFGARGMGMGNALTAVRDGDISAYYNPAATPFLDQRLVAASFGLLSLDRSLNTLSYSQAIRPSAGFSVGILNAGVRNIDGRDADGYPTEQYYTSENQFSFSFANRMSQYVSLGIGLKIYYYRLFEKVSSTNLGVDVGGLVKVSDHISLGVVVQDIGSKYKWDTSQLYGELGNSTVEPFPLLRKIGVSYSFGNHAGVVSLDWESSNKGSNIIRAGGELALTDAVTVRAGLDHIDTNDLGEAAPTFGFSIDTPFDGYTPVLNYAYVIEPYGVFGMHVISLSARF